MPGANSSNVVGRSLGSDGGGRTAMRHMDYLEVIIRNGQTMSHDYSHQSTDEDPHMIAFFDSLVRRERDGWTSDEDEDSLSRDDDVDDHALDYHHTEQSSSDESTSEGNPRPQSGVVFRPMRYPQVREPDSGPLDGSLPVQQSTVSGPDPNTPQSCVRHSRKTRRAMLRRLGRMIPITSFVSSHTPSEESSSESTTTASVDSSSEDSDDSESSSTSRSSVLTDQSPLCDLSKIADPHHEIADPLTLRHSRESLTRLKRLREHALNSDDDSGEFSSSSPSTRKRIAVGNPLPPPPTTTIPSDFCDNLLDDCKSPVKLNGKSQSCSESVNGTNELGRLTDFTRNAAVAESQEGATAGCGDLERLSSASVDQELCSILNQVSNGDATGVGTSSSDRFHSCRLRTKSGSRRYRRTVVDTDADHSSDED